MFSFNRGPDMPNVPKYFLYISYGSTLTANVKAKRSTSKLRSLLPWSKVQDLCNTNVLLIHWLKPFLKVYWKISLSSLKTNADVILGAIFRMISFRAKCLWLSTKKKEAQIFETRKDSYVTKLIYKSLSICTSFFFRVLVKEIIAVKKKKWFWRLTAKDTVRRFLEWTPLHIYASSRPIKKSRDQIISH